MFSVKWEEINFLKFAILSQWFEVNGIFWGIFGNILKKKLYQLQLIKILIKTLFQEKCY